MTEADRLRSLLGGLIDIRRQIHTYGLVHHDGVADLDTLIKSFQQRLGELKK